MRKFNNVTIDQFRNDFQKAVKEVEEKWGVNITAQRITYGPDSCRFKVAVEPQNKTIISPKPTTGTYRFNKNKMLYIGDKCAIDDPRGRKYGICTLVKKNRVNWKIKSETGIMVTVPGDFVFAVEQ